jgi:hypothetical protein
MASVPGAGSREEEYAMVKKATKKSPRKRKPARKKARPAARKARKPAAKKSARKKPVRKKARPTARKARKPAAKKPARKKPAAPPAMPAPAPDEPESIRHWGAEHDAQAGPEVVMPELDFEDEEEDVDLPEGMGPTSESDEEW